MQPVHPSTSPTPAEGVVSPSAADVDVGNGNDKVTGADTTVVEVKQEQKGGGEDMVQHVETDEELLARLKEDREWWNTMNLLADEIVVRQARELEGEYADPSRRSILQVIFDPPLRETHFCDYFLCTGLFFMPMFPLMLLRWTQKSFYWIRRLPLWFVNPLVLVQPLLIIAFWAIVCGIMLFIFLFSSCMFCMVTGAASHASFLVAKSRAILAVTESAAAVQISNRRPPSSGKFGWWSCFFMVAIMGYYYFGAFLIAAFSVYGFVFWLPFQILVWLSVLLQAAIIGACVSDTDSSDGTPHTKAADDAPTTDDEGAQSGPQGGPQEGAPLSPHQDPQAQPASAATVV